MDDKIIQAYLWQEVTRLGFSPISDKDKMRWLSQYGKSLRDFWEIEEYPTKYDDNELKVFHSALMIEYLIKKPIDVNKYAISLYYLSNTWELMWTHDVDLQYFSFPENSLLIKYGKIKKARRNVSSSHIENVLNGLLFHPAIHQHIQSPIDNHEIRIGGGIYNPFVFLFHLRYQLCPIEDKRNTEKTRVINLFVDAIRNGKQVPAGNLFGLT